MSEEKAAGSGEVASPHEVDLGEAAPEEIRAEIDRTRARMDEHLSQLGRKLKGGPAMKRARYPLAALAAAVAGFLIFRAVRKRVGKGAVASKRKRLP